MSRVVLKIEGMSCSACSNSLEKYLNKQENIKNAKVNLVLALACIEYQNLSIEEINQYVKEAGFKSLGIYKKESLKKSSKVKNLIIYGCILIITMYISMAHMLNLIEIPFLSIKRYPENYSLVLFILSMIFIFYGKNIISSGFKNIFYRHPNMDSLVAIGTLTSLVYSFVNMILVLLGNNKYVNYLYFESVATIIYFIKLGRYVDSTCKNNTKSALNELVSITPEYAILKGGQKVTIDEVKIGDILISSPGSKIAVDGEIIKGDAHFDEAFITGESKKVKKSIKDRVLAGSLNYDGYIEYKALKIGTNSTISEIIKLVIDASNNKSKVSRLVDKLCSIFIPLVILIAFITLIICIILGYSLNESLIIFVTILVVSCPCALGLATPLVTIISVGKLAKEKILIKTGEAIENVNKIDTIVFDKTGILTYGDLKLSRYFNYGNYSNTELLKIVASLESKSSHPIAKAFEDYDIYNVDDFNSLSGIGLYGKINNKEIYIGNSKLFSKLKIENNYILDEEKLVEKENSIIYVIENKKVIGLIGVKDVVRNSIKETIIKLKNKYNIIMLTGDSKVTAHAVAASLEIDNVEANLSPKEKNDYIMKLQKNNHKVIMIGDGINDALALTTSNVGISFNSATDIAANSSDIILINNDLNSLINLFEISKKSVRNIKQNLFWAFAYNLCMIPIAIGLLKPLGITINPMIASLTMVLSSLTVTLNTLRLKLK